MSVSRLSGTKRVFHIVLLPKLLAFLHSIDLALIKVDEEAFGIAPLPLSPQASIVVPVIDLAKAHFGRFLAVSLDAVLLDSLETLLNLG